MNDLMLFRYAQNDVRVVMCDGEPFWVAKDVCSVFGDTNYRRSVARLDEDERGVSQMHTPGGPQEMTVVNEAGLYSLLFYMQPQKANMAEEQIQQRIESLTKFRRWVTHEVLPAIRKTGSYSIDIPRTYAEALRLAADQAEEIERQQKALAEAKPKVEFFDAVASSKDAIQIGHAAKVLNCGIGRNRLFAFLREQGVLMADNTPFQAQIDRGHFRTIEQRWTTPDGETRISIKTLVYQRGLDYIRKLMAATG